MVTFGGSTDTNQTHVDSGRQTNVSRPLTNHFHMSNKAGVTRVVHYLRVVQVKINQHQIAGGNHISTEVNSPPGVLADELRHPRVLSIPDADGLRGTRQHEEIHVEADLMTFLNLQEKNNFF